MPGMNGLELAGEARQVRADLPVILVTGFGNALSEQSLQTHRINLMLRKPNTMEALAAALHGVLAGEAGPAGPRPSA